MIGLPDPTPPLLVAEGLVKDYGPTRALDGASLHVYPGEVPALLGSSGSGRSTLLHCLAALGARDARMAAREPDWSQEEPPPRGADTLLIARTDTEYRGVQIHGRVVRPEGPRAPPAPGVTRWPGPGELVVSPALARLLDSDEGALLRERWRARVVGTIGPEGLAGPGEYAYYLGSDRLTADTPVVRVRAFGGSRSCRWGWSVAGAATAGGCGGGSPCPRPAWPCSTRCTTRPACAASSVPGRSRTGERSAAFRAGTPPIARRG